MPDPTSSQAPPAACDITFFIACYNESGNIVPAIKTVVAAANEACCSYDIVVIDDASKDSSVEEIGQFMDEHPELPIMLLINSKNQGFGINYAEGAFHGRGKYYRVICGDNEERQDSLVRALGQMGKADIVTTYLDDATARSFSRRAISKTYTTIVNCISGYKLHYYNGLPIIPRKVVTRWHSHSHGFGFQADIICRLLDMGATIIEVPVVAQFRASGVTKAFTFRNIASVGHTILELFCRRSARVLYPQYVTKLAQDPAQSSTPAFNDPSLVPKPTPDAATTQAAPKVQAAT